MSIDCLHLQVAELEVCVWYPHEIPLNSHLIGRTKQQALAAAIEADGGRLVYTTSEDANLALAQAGVETNTLPSHLDPLSGTLALPGARLGFTLPPNYPEHASPHLLLQMQGRVTRCVIAPQNALKLLLFSFSNNETATIIAWALRSRHQHTGGAHPLATITPIN